MLTAHLPALASTEDGWNDRGGKAPDKSGLHWLAQQTTLLAILSGEHDLYSKQFAPPFITPTHEGGVEAMWRHGNHHATLEIDLENHTGYYHASDTASEDWSEQDLILESQEDIGNFMEKLSSIAIFGSVFAISPNAYGNSDNDVGGGKTRGSPP